MPTITKRVFNLRKEIFNLKCFISCLCSENTRINKALKKEGQVDAYLYQKELNILKLKQLREDLKTLKTELKEYLKD